MKCIFKDKSDNKCGLEAKCPSFHDEPKDTKNGQIVNYRRTKNWHCPAGHWTHSESTVNASEIKLPEVPEIDDDAKSRFHRKGFSGHKVNPSGTKLARKNLANVIYEPTLTNHKRHQIRQQQRNKMQEASRNGKVAQ